MTLVLAVPRGAEAAAVRRGNAGARIVELPAGKVAADALPGFGRDDTVIVLGLCGALRRWTVGDVVVYGTVTDDAVTCTPDAALAATIARALGGAPVVRACTTERVVTTVRERRVLAERYDAEVVDMEGARVAGTLAARGVRFAMVRVVSDDASRDLPAIDAAIRDDGSLDAARIAVAFARRPRAAYAFIRDVRRALATLATATRALTSSSASMSP